MNESVDVNTVPSVIMQTTDPKHGLALYVAECITALARRGLRASLLCPANFAYADKARAAGVEVVQVGERETSPAGIVQRLLRNLIFAANMARVQFRLLRGRDIVHLQSAYNLPLGFAFFLAAKLRGSFIVLTVHDPLPHKWRFPRATRWLERKMLATAYALSDRLLVHNDVGREILVHEFGQNSERIAIVPHGAYAPVETATDFPSFDRIRLLAFGSIRENKGLHLAIEAVQNANVDRGHIPVHLTIAGTPYNAGEREYWDCCKQRIARAPENIEVIERYVEDDEVQPLIARHHCMLLPYTTFYSESGVAILALSHARPILATATGSMGELIERGACGVPIASASVDCVAEAIRTATHLGAQRLQTMGKNGSTFVRHIRSWEANADATIEVYSSLATRVGIIAAPTHAAQSSSHAH
jgi:glycosyltransferase involved in cell wall biosynthesis